jgi:regulator of sirC expression with transglutaminase-like and TPR domain
MQFRKALSILEAVLALSPASSEDLKQRGFLHYQLRNYRQARLDLESYLFLNPQAEDAGQVREKLEELRAISAMLN